MKKYKLSKESLVDLESREWETDFILVGGLGATLEEVKEPLKNGDKVRYKSINSEWQFGWYKSVFNDCYNNGGHYIYSLQGEEAGWSFCEVYDWTYEDLLPDALKVVKK